MVSTLVPLHAIREREDVPLIAAGAIVAAEAEATGAASALDRRGSDALNRRHMWSIITSQSGAEPMLARAHENGSSMVAPSVAPSRQLHRAAVAGAGGLPVDRLAAVPAVAAAQHPQGLAIAVSDKPAHRSSSQTQRCARTPRSP